VQNSQGRIADEANEFLTTDRLAPRPPHGWTWILQIFLATDGCEVQKDRKRFL
jgi:hypothetical protein